MINREALLEAARRRATLAYTRFCGDIDAQLKVFDGTAPIRVIVPDNITNDQIDRIAKEYMGPDGGWTVKYEAFSLSSKQNALVFS